MLVPRFYSEDAPPARTFEQNRTTLLVSWWCTGFAIAIILLRLVGRFIRMEQLLREDIIMAGALVFILFRMGLAHIVLFWGTNNTITMTLSDEDIYHREIGSKVVLALRIIYAAALWIEKSSITESLYRLMSQVWRKSYERSIQFLRWLLLLTFLGVVASTLTECRPFHKYWQVVPDPGPQCRLGYAQLATLGTASVMTNLLLVGIPIPMIVRSRMNLRRKASLVLIFGLSLAPVGVTLFRIPTIVERNGSQQYRTLLASFEILVATLTSNALTLVSFVRDRGPKKNRFKIISASENMSRPSTRPEGRLGYWGSDEELARSLGINLRPELRDIEALEKPRLAPMVLPPMVQTENAAVEAMVPRWKQTVTTTTSSELDMKSSDLTKSPTTGSVFTARRVTFFDVGGLLEEEEEEPPRSLSSTPIIDLYAQTTPPVSYDHDSAPPPSPQLNPYVRRNTQYQSIGSRLTGVDLNKPLPDLPIIRLPGPLWQTPSFRHTCYDNIQPLQDVGGLLTAEPDVSKQSRHSIQ